MAHNRQGLAMVWSRYSSARTNVEQLTNDYLTINSLIMKQKPKLNLSSEPTAEDLTSSQTIAKPHVGGSTVSLQDIIESKYCLDMRGDENWGKRLDALRKVLKAATPKSNRPAMPSYCFTPYYYVMNGEWFEGTWQRFPPVNPLDVVW